MRKDFQEHVGRLCNVQPAVIRWMYRLLTEDSCAAVSARQADVDRRVLLAIDAEDDSLLWDLRQLNEGRPALYEQFWEECDKYLTEAAATAVDDRRHGDVVHIASAVSVPDLHRIVCSRLEVEVPKPSVKWLAFQFWPKDPARATAAQYTGRLKVKYMVQARQMRLTHPDSHYASALYRYLREFAVGFRSHSVMICQDDKHHCKVGEPDIHLQQWNVESR